MNQEKDIFAVKIDEFRNEIQNGFSFAEIIPKLKEMVQELSAVKLQGMAMGKDGGKLTLEQCQEFDKIFIEFNCDVLYGPYKKKNIEQNLTFSLLDDYLVKFVDLAGMADLPAQALLEIYKELYQYKVFEVQKMSSEQIKLELVKMKEDEQKILNEHRLFFVFAMMAQSTEFQPISHPSCSPSSSDKKFLIIGIVIGAIILLLFIAFLLILTLRKKKKKTNVADVCLEKK